MHPKCKEQVTIRQIFGFVVNLALTAAVIYAAVFLLGKGSIHYREESQWALGILIGLPVGCVRGGARLCPSCWSMTRWCCWARPRSPCC